MPTRKRILVVDDEPDLTELLAYNLQRRGYDATIASNGIEAINLAENNPPDLIVLDIMMPRLGGIETAARLRRMETTADIPVIMLTAKAGEDDELAGLDAGADDYVTKPFSMRVLLARIEAVLRRRDPAARPQPAATTVGPLTIDTDAHIATLRGDPLQVTVTEFKLLAALMSADGKVLSRAAMITRAIGPGVTVTARTIDVHITAIRRKLGGDATMIQTVRGVGYRLLETQMAEV